MYKYIKPGSIDWAGVKRVIVHAAILGLGYIVMSFEQWLVGHNFGNYQMLVMATNSVAIKFLEKFFSGYNVTITGSVAENQ